MNEDPIVAEVRRVRAARARCFNYDVHAIFADLMKRGQAEDSSHPLVRDAAEWTESHAGDLTLRELPESK